MEKHRLNFGKDEQSGMDAMADIFRNEIRNMNQLQIMQAVNAFQEICTFYISPRTVSEKIKRSQ